MFCAHTVTIYNPVPWLPVELAKLGVWGFFIVSGYIVARATEEHYAGRPGAFISNRALRILPAFLATYVLAWCALLLVGPTADPGVPPGISIDGLGVREFLLGASILGSWSDANVFAPNPPAWSIFVEAVFYVAMTLVLLARHRAAFVTAALAMFFVPPVSAHLGPITLLNVSGPFKYAPLFVLGAAIFAVQQRATVAAIAMLVVSSLLTIGSVFGLQHILYRPADLGVDRALVYNALGLVALVLIMAWLASCQAKRWAKFDKTLGDLTYPLYLVHVPVLALIWVAPHERTAANWLLSLAICLAASWVVVRFIEVPVSVARNWVRTARHPTYSQESSPARS